MSKVIWGDDKVWKNESQFLTYLRGCLREAWKKHPNKLELLKTSKVKIKNPNPSSAKRFPDVNGYICACCNQQITQKDAVVDHIVPAGSLRSLDDIQGFVTRLLLVDKDDLRVICKNCNTTLAYSDKHGISFSDARIMKQIISLEKKKEINKIISSFGEKPESNASKRRKQLFRLMKNSV